MILPALIALQAAAAAQAQAPPPPDIELRADATVRRVRIERSGEASLEVTGGEGSIVRVEAPEAGGRAALRNVRVRVRAEARIDDPRNLPPAETAQPQ